MALNADVNEMGGPKRSTLPDWHRRGIRRISAELRRRTEPPDDAGFFGPKRLALGCRLSDVEGWLLVHLQSETKVHFRDNVHESMKVSW